MWKKGRQNSGYNTWTFLKFSAHRFKFDGHIIHFPQDSNIPKHIDKVDHFNHYRLNIILKKSKQGGNFQCQNPKLNILNRIYFFQPDISEHSVSTIRKGNRFVLSFGLALKKT